MEPLDTSHINPADIPSPPAAIAQIVRRASDPAVTSEQLGQLINSDPAFTAELLRTVNSPFYGLKTQISSASRAATVVGCRALRNLAICFAVRDSLRNSPFPPEDLKRFWEDALRRAVSARLVARAFCPQFGEEAFTVGLLQDFGVLALLRSRPDEIEAWTELRQLDPGAWRAEEIRRFGTGHDEVAKLLGDRWGLPASLSAALAFHHDPESAACLPAHKGMARIAYTADIIANVFTARDSKGALEGARQLLVRGFAMKSESVDDLLSRVGPELEEASTALGMRVARQPPWEEVVIAANRTLVQMNTSYEELTRRLELALTAKEEAERKLTAAYQKLEMVAYFDPLTALCNRRRFQTLFAQEIVRATEDKRPLSLIMIDLDHFKRLNDTHGHSFGDAVLQAVARVLMSAARTGDVKARLGGEELAVLLPETGAEMAGQVAEKLRGAIAALTLTAAQGVVQVTASLGGATWHGRAVGQAEVEAVVRQLMDTADAALYRSKHGGRNRVTWAGGSAGDGVHATQPDA
jgi:diguanylate cyclase (GGDEF)-like protein